MSSVWDDPEPEQEVDQEEVTPLPSAMPESSALELSPEKLEVITAQVVEKVAREIVPEIAERLVQEHLEKLLRESEE